MTIRDQRFGIIKSDISIGISLLVGDSSVNISDGNISISRFPSEVKDQETTASNSLLLVCEIWFLNISEKQSF